MVTIENQQSHLYVVNEQLSTSWFEYLETVLGQFGLQVSPLLLTEHLPQLAEDYKNSKLKACLLLGKFESSIFNLL